MIFQDTITITFPSEIGAWVDQYAKTESWGYAKTESWGYNAKTESWGYAKTKSWGYAKTESRDYAKTNSWAYTTDWYFNFSELIEVC